MLKYLSVILLFLVSLMAYGQACTTAICNASSPSESDFLAALPASSNTNATVVVNIPSGTSAWTTGFSYTVPAAITSLTIQGNTTVLWSGTPGTSSWNYSYTNNTIIQDAYQSHNPLISITFANNPSALFRITGITWQGGSIGGTSYSKFNGFVFVYGGKSQLRYDHNVYDLTTYSPYNTSVALRFYGQVTGVADHNVLIMGPYDSGTKLPTTTQVFSFAFSDFSPYNDTIGNGDGTWAHATAWGSSTSFYVEDNYFIGGWTNDCGDAGAMVLRYNTIHSYTQTHGTKSPAGPERGCRMYEAYHNYISGPTSGIGPLDAVFGSKIGSMLIWGNSVNLGFYRMGNLCTDRNNCEGPETAVPNGWGYCGTAASSNGIGSPWDGNNNTSSGWPCLDGIGRGQTQQALNGGNFPSRTNSSTGTQSWPHQYLEPAYFFDNTTSLNSGSYITFGSTDMANNRDVYYDCGSLNPTCSTFNGTAGTGSGLLSARPATCTPGPGGTYGQSPTGSYGVAYWATDANSGNGELFVCTAANTWTGIYTPYTYPHPLNGGGGTTFYNLGVNATNGTVSGTNTAPGTYAAGTTIGPATATPNGGFTFSSWTGCPSPSGNVCAAFSLNSNTTLTANFTSSTPQAARPTASPGTGVLSGPTAVTLACTTASPTIYYTTDGSTPTHSSSVYSSPVAIGSGTYTTFKAICTAAGYTDSSVLTSPYLVVSAGPQSISAGVSTGSVNSFTITLTGANSLAVGDMAVVMVTYGGGFGIPISISDSEGNTNWVQITSGLTVDQDTIVLGCVNVPVAGDLTITASPQNGGNPLRMVAFKAVGTVCDPQLVTPVSNPSSVASACNSGPMTTPSSSLLIGVCATDGSTTALSAGTGWSNPQTAGIGSSVGILGESQISGAGTYTATSANFSTGTAEQVGIVAAFSPSTNTNTCADPVQKGSANGYPTFSYSNTYTSPPTTLPLNIGFVSPTTACHLVMTLDGSEPSCASSPAYSDLSISLTTNMRVKACNTGYNDSTPQGGLWTIVNGGSGPGAPVHLGGSIIVGHLL